MLTFKKAENQILKAIQMDYEESLSKYACKNSHAIREFISKYDMDVLRSQYAIDVDKIINNWLYNRGGDKTQVFSFFRNDDITRRSSHMQLVSRIARTIGKALRLNLELIEAIAIGHDVGHTPFGHKGEEFLNELYHSYTGRYFNHNVHSVRVLQKITSSNLTLQTLNGILCHCGEKAFENYEPAPMTDLKQFNKLFDNCYTEKNMIHRLRPSTLEGCVVRISDMIAYLGKDRQDAVKAKLKVNFKCNPLGKTNPEIITAIITDVVANSIEKPYLSMSPDVYNAISTMLNENKIQIYQRDEVIAPYYSVIKPMMKLLYERFLTEFDEDNYDSLIYQHYLNGSIVKKYYKGGYIKYAIDKNIHNPNDVVTDYIASMTDDYFIDVFKYLFPENKLINELENIYIEYFDDRYTKHTI